MDTSKYKGLYLQEAGEHISGIEQGLLALEKDPAEAATVDRLFRHYHTIKGMSASMGYEPVQKLAHAQESLLDKVRSGELAVTTPMVSTLFECLDQLKAFLRLVTDDAPLDVDISPFLASLTTVAEGGSAPEGTADAGARAPEKRPEAAQSEAAPAETGETAAPAVPESIELSGTMKVDGHVFDDLLVTVGELFMELTSFKSLSQTLRSVPFKDTLHLLGKSINKLHSSILQARMLPLEDLTAGLPRVVRDLSVKTGKRVALATDGMDISLDRAILENLGGPLVHMIRNSVDHGMEPPEERARLGKPPEGTISIKAYARKDRVVLEVVDDGRGIDAEKIKVKAASKGLSLQRLRTMTHKEILMLVCTPGFTTSSTVTDTSGRGVGMDVVKSAIEGLGGTLELDSVYGRGTTIRMELPRTTAIIKALLVSISEELFLVPISKVEKVLEVDAAAAERGSIDYNEMEVPLIPLGAALGVAEAPERSTYTVVLVEDPGPGVIDPVSGLEYKRFVGLKVDDFGEEIDAYIKPLTPPMSRVKGVSGITITGEGRPVFLVDIPGVLNMAGSTGN